MEKKNALRNAILLSLLVGATAVYSPVVLAAEEAADQGAMEFAMEEYVVTASRTQTAKVDTPANVSTIDAEKIESRRYQDVAEALKDVPGVTIVDNGYGSMEKTVVLNGDERVLVLVDGRRVNLDMGTTTSRSSFDLNNMPDVSQIERIEVVKGHGGALYGSDAVGGVINIITKKMDHSFGKVSMAFGSNQARDARALYSIKENKTGVMLSTSKVKQGYAKYKDASDGTVKRWPEETKYNNEKVSLKINQELNDISNLTIGYDYSKYDGCSPTYVSVPYDHSAYSVMSKKVNSTYIKYDWTINKNDDGYVQFYRNKYDYFNKDDYSVSLLDEITLGMEVQQAISTSENNKLIVGASYRKSKANNNLAYSGKEYSINNKAVFVNNIWDFADKWSLNTGARWDDHSTAGSKTTLSAGLNKKFDENSHAYINWGQVFKAPTIDDLYYSYYGALSNPELKPEKGETWTVGYSTKLGDKTGLDISYFHSKLKDAIDWQYVGWIYQVRNVTEQKKNGMELTLTHQLNDNWDLEASYTYVKVQDNEDGAGYVRDRNYAPNNYRLGAKYHDDKWNVDLFLKAVSGADTQSNTPPSVWNANKYYLDSHFITIDMAVSYKPAKAWTVYAKGYNLTNKAYAEHAGAKDGYYAYPAQSRRFIVGAEYSF